MNDISVSIIIVNWNTGHLLRACLDSLPAACGAEQAEVFVVDNASIDQSIAYAEGSVQSFRLFPLPKNSGFARANNVGIRQATGKYILLLNPDTVARPGSIETLLGFLRAHPNAAVVGPRLLNPDGTLQPSCRRFPTLPVLAAMTLKLHHLFPRAAFLRRYLMDDFSYTSDQLVDQVMGACMALPGEAIDRIGLLDEGYWIWFEEVDWCKRFLEAGREVWFTPTAEVVHERGASFRQVLPVQKEWRFLRAAIRYARKHLGNMAAVFLLLLAPFALLLDTLVFAFRKRSA